MHRFKVGMLALFLSVSAAAPLAAQEWYVGAEAGLNISDFSVGDDEEPDSETGIRVGGVVRYDFAPNGLIGIQTGAAYSQKGASQTVTIDDVVVSGVVDLAYIEIPLLLAVNVPTNSGVRPRVYAGPQIAFETSCDVSLSALGESEEDSCENFEIMTKGTDFSLLFGGGLEVAAGPGVITFDGRYDLGLTDIDEDQFAETKNRNIQLMAGYAFRLQ